jgi:hypothetical protein
MADGWNIDRNATIPILKSMLGHVLCVAAMVVIGIRISGLHAPIAAT